jgi:hypothetical protein
VTAQPRSRYATGTAANMIRSLLAIGAVLAVFFFLVPRVSSVSQPPVDVESAAKNVVRTTGWAISVPRGLPDGWQASAARYVRSTDGLMTWHAGYVSPAGHYVALEQTRGATRGWIEAQTNRAARVGELTAAGRTWVKFNRDTKVQRSLLDQPSDPRALATLITGDGTFEELTVLIDHLHVVSTS